jgi:hypothetical protein
MLLALKPFTLGTTVQWTVDYSEHPCTSDPFTIAPPYPVRDGDSITSATVTCDKVDVTLTAATVFEGHKVVFKISGASVNELFTVTVTIITSNTETFKDTIQFQTVSP